MDDFQWKTGGSDEQVIRLASSPSLLFNLVVYHFACRLFLIMESYIICCFCLIKLQPVQSARALWWFLTSWNGRQRFEKSSCPSSSAFISIFFFFFLSVCVYLSVTDKSRFGPNRLWGLVLSLGHVGCQGARKCPPALRNCQWKRYHQINLSWASWDMGLGVRINTRKKYITLDRALALAGLWCRSGNC